MFFVLTKQGLEVIALLEQKTLRFYLILLDIMMPGLDDFKVCRIINENPEMQDIPVIFLTAKVDVDAISNGFVLGTLGFLCQFLFSILVYY